MVDLVGRVLVLARLLPMTPECEQEVFFAQQGTPPKVVNFNVASTTRPPRSVSRERRRRAALDRVNKALGHPTGTRQESEPQEDEDDPLSECLLGCVNCSGSRSTQWMARVV